MVTLDSRLNLFDITQPDEILLLAVRKADEGFTRADGWNQCHCFETPARICDLKKHGWRFETKSEYVKRRNRRRGTSIVRWKLDSEQLNEAIIYLNSKYKDAD